MFVSCECCVLLSGRGLCDEPIPRPEESYRLWCVSQCDQKKLQTSTLERETGVGRRERLNTKKKHMGREIYVYNTPHGQVCKAQCDHSMFLISWTLAYIIDNVKFSLSLIKHNALGRMADWRRSPTLSYSRC
jgi:hypothetical protein